MGIFENTYTGLVPTFYNTLIPTDEDNTSLRSIIESFEIQILPSDIVQITNTPNDGILCKTGYRWWEELGVSEEDVSEVLTSKRSMQVKDIHTSHLLTNVRVVYFVVQHIVLPRSGNTNIMSEVDQMVMFCLMARRTINLMRLILDFIFSAVDAIKRSHAALPYGMVLTRVFARAQLPIDEHRKDDKRPTTTRKTFSALGLETIN